MTRSVRDARVAARNFGSALKIGQATGSGVTATTSAPVNGLTVLTVAGWFFINSAGPGSLGRLFYKGNGSGDSAWIEAFFGAGSSLNIYTSWTIQGQWKQKLPLLGAWHHLAIGYDGSSPSNAPTLYVDGVTQSLTQVQAPSGSRTADTTNLNVGSAGFSTTRYADATISAFRIFNRVLSAAEVAVLYQSSIAPSGLVLEYLMNEGSGTSVHDTSGLSSGNGVATGCSFVANAPSQARLTISSARPPASSRASV